MLRLHPPLLTNLDEWVEGQKDRPSRPEAIRRLVERSLAGRGAARSSAKEAARKAR
jgi:hypothetical protein